MLVLTSSKANIVSERPGYKDYIFYTDLRIDQLKFKILHSIEFIHESSDKYGLFHVYVLFGGSGEEYYVGSFFQEEKAKKNSFSGAQQLHTIDNGSVAESVVTIRVYYTNFLSRTVFLPGYSVDLGTPSNYIPTLGNLDGTNYNAVARGNVAFNPGYDRFPFVTLLEGGYIDYSSVCIHFGTTNRWTHAFRYRTTNTNVKLFSYRDSNDSLINIDIDENGKVRINGIGDQPFRNDDNVWRMLFITPFDAIVRAHILYGDGQMLTIPPANNPLNIDITPSNTVETYIGANLVDFHLAESTDFVRYVSADGTDSGSTGMINATVPNDPPMEVIHDGRNCLYFNPGPTGPPQVFDLSTFANTFDVPAVTVSFWFWLDSVNGSNSNSVFCIQDTLTKHDLFDIFILQRNPIPRINVTMFDNVNGSSVQKLLISAFINTDEWTHISVVIAADTYKMYLNGHEPATYNNYNTFGYSGFNIDSVIDTANRVTIGSRTIPTQNTAMDGIYIGDLMMFRRAFDDTDALDLYNNERRLITGGACDIAQIISADKTIFGADRELLYAEEGEYESGELANWNLRMKIEQV